MRPELKQPVRILYQINIHTGVPVNVHIVAIGVYGFLYITTRGRVYPLSPLTLLVKARDIGKFYAFYRNDIAPFKRCDTLSALLYLKAWSKHIVRSSYSLRAFGNGQLIGH